MPINITNITATQRESALRLMASAFQDDPLFLAVFGRDKRRARAFLGFMFDMNGLLDGEILGAFEDGNLLGCLLIERPQPRPSFRYWTRMIAVLGRFVPLAFKLGSAKVATLNNYVVQTRAAATGRCAYLVMVGVDPNRQGRGIGRLLVEQAFERAIAWKADGLALDTENPANVPLYERLGFTLGEELDLGAFTSFCMYRMIEP